jgi:hypothetical protein
MNSPEEKAKELVDKMWVYALPNANGSWNNAKQCALIDVENTIEALHYADTDYDLLKYIEYYQKVKQEIEKL